MRLKLFRVSGDSMCPAYNDGDYVLTLRHRRTRIRSGDVVAVDHPRLGYIIKRVARITGDDEVELSGDNASRSTDSEVLGLVSTSKLIGKVVWQTAAP